MGLSSRQCCLISRAGTGSHNHNHRFYSFVECKWNKCKNHFAWGTNSGLIRGEKVWTIIRACDPSNNTGPKISDLVVMTDTAVWVLERSIYPSLSPSFPLLSPGSDIPGQASLVFDVVLLDLHNPRDGISVTNQIVPESCTRKSVAGDFVRYHYNGSLLDGTFFDSRYMCVWMFVCK